MLGEEMVIGRSGIESEKRMMRVIGREGGRGLDILAACCYIFGCGGSFTFCLLLRRRAECQDSVCRISSEPVHMFMMTDNNPLLLNHTRYLHCWYTRYYELWHLSDRVQLCEICSSVTTEDESTS